MRVLIVEDELLIADYLAMLVEEAGHSVAGIAATGEDALRLLDAGVADVATLDVRLAGALDGVAVAEVLRRRGGPPFLFVTASGDPDWRARCAACGPVAVLQKPVNPDALLAALRRLG